ncbi:hypothetical protein [Nocardia suismassiliense]|uniref:hypothetical protein n=1 Tax=Nocardia suismassiliense TaxID=2077092 RepID=UPI000D1FD629|nr:hypothetical protein [Nocardia suismassiliense]
MGSDDEEDHDDTTPQQHCYRQVHWLRHYGTNEQLAKYTAGGPPRPSKKDGVIGKILFYEVNTPTVDEVAALLEEMERAGWITSTIRKSIAQLSTHELMAELKARMIERDSGPGLSAAGME